MSKYEIRYDSRAQDGFEAGEWRCADGRETALLYTPYGMFELLRQEAGLCRAEYASIVGIIHGRYCHWYIPPRLAQPCPTRAGLVRMACREIRKIVGEKK